MKFLALINMVATIGLFSCSGEDAIQNSRSSDASPATAAEAQRLPDLETSGVIERVEKTEEFGETDEVADLNLIGGKVVDPAGFPASIYISSGNSSCSATVVGPRTVITAAHCVANGGQIQFTSGPNRYSGKCSHHPSYRRNSTADWALCRTNVEVIGIEFEVLNSDPKKLEQGQTILLTGYGCTASNGKGGNDGRYRTGESTIIRVPQTSSSNNDIVSQGQGAALCFGDSGGPAFVYLDDARTMRVLVGVNSRGDIKTTSYLSSVAQPVALSWVRSWMDENQEKICGIAADAPRCRAGTANPIAPVTAACLKMEKEKALPALTACALAEKPDVVACLQHRDIVSACIESKI